MAFTKIAPAGLSTSGNFTFGDVTVNSIQLSDGSAVGGAGLGTAIDGNDQIYYTNTVLSIGSTTTIDPPDSSNIAYTQYAEIAVEEGFDLIVEDGDDLVPDILGLSTGTAAPLAGAGGRVRADNFTNKAGTGAPTFPNGVNVTGNVAATSATFSGTEAITLPRGTTAERPGYPVNGMLRYNTTLGAAEQYRNNVWVSIDVAPVISSISPTSYNGAAGTTFTITGSGFQSTDTVKFVTTGGAEYTAGTVGFVGVTTLTATTPQNFTAEDDPITVKVVTLSGLTVTGNQTISTGGTPTWNTAAGTISTIYDKYGSYAGIATLSATDPDGQSVTYSVTSGSLPGGTSLNSNTGTISGDPTDLTVATETSNFTVAASDGVNSTSRSFSMVVNAAMDGTSSFRAALNGADIKALNSSASDGTYWINPYTTVAYANPQQYTVDMANDGWITVDLADAATNLNNHLSYYSGAGNSVINWDSSIANYLYIASANSGANSNNWNAMMTDRELLGRSAEFLAWRDWDVSFRLSFDWGWGQLGFSPVSNFTGSWTDDAATNSGTYGISGTGDARIVVRNNNSNDLHQLSYDWWDGSGEANSVIYNQPGGGSGNTQTYRFTLIQGTVTHYIGGTQVAQADLTNTSTYSNTGVTSDTRWIWFNQHQSTSWLAISEMKVRNPAT